MTRVLGAIAAFLTGVLLLGIVSGRVEEKPPLERTRVTDYESVVQEKTVEAQGSMAAFQDRRKS